MYADYIKELGSGKVMYTNEKGFAIYSIINDNCYLEDLYVKPHFRGTSAATELANIVSAIGKENGCIRLLGSVLPSTKVATNNMKIFLHYGMAIAEASQNFILLTKDI